MSELNLIGSTLGRFEIQRELGRGGMAVVYQARQTDLDRVVALKVLPPALTHDAAYVARFRQEARSAARLEHPHIMPIYEVGEAGGLHYIAMKYIAGETVKDLVQREGALTVQRAALILAQVGEALDYAHKQGVIHRDIKPSNMMITDEGWVYLTDFGLARGTGGAAGLTMAGTVMGTPEYMSPEQAQGLANVGPPTDIYALGVVLYELLTGTFPFKADTPMGMLAARLLQAPTPPRDVRGDLPPPVEDVVMRALARRPEARFPTAAAMVAALRAAAGIGSAEPPRPETPAAGVPAMGATIKVPVPPRATPLPPIQTPGAGSPYVQQRPPLDATVPVGQPQQAAPAPASPVAPPHTPHGVPLSLPTGGATPPPVAPARKGPRNLVVILGALGAVALACVGLAITLAIREGPTTGPGNGVTAGADGDLNVLIAEADESLSDEGGLATAIEAYTAMLDAYPNSPRILARLAMAYNAGGDWPNAEEFANQLIDAPDSDTTQVGLGYALLADAYASQGDLTAALGEIGQAIENAPELALGHAIESNLLAYRAVAAGDTAEMDTALASLDRAVDTMADEEPIVQALTQHALGYTFGQEHQLSGSADYLRQSEEAYRRAIELLPASGLFRSNLAYLLMRDEDYAGARDLFEEAVAAGHLPAHAGIGWSYYHEGETEQAEEAFDQAITEAPDAPDGYYGKGRLRYDEGDYDGAVELLTQAVERNPRSPELQGWLGEAWFWKGFYGEGAAAEEAFAQAAAAYKRAIERDERAVFSISGLAWTLQHQEDYAASVETFDQAIALDPNDASLYDGKGWSLFNQGSYGEAEAAFRQAIVQDGDYAEAHYHLGRALEEQGRADEAREAYTRALELDPDLSAAQEHLDGLGAP